MSTTNPTQTRTLDTFNEQRFSSAINKYNNIYTGGEDWLLYEDSSFLFDTDTTNSGISTTHVPFTPGYAIKDNVLIHISSYSYVDFAVDRYYLDEDPGMISAGWYYIVLYYNCTRQYPAPEAYYRILRDTSLFETYQSNKRILSSVFFLRIVFDSSREVIYSSDCSTWILW